MQRPDRKKRSSSKIMKWIISILVVLAVVTVAVIATTILITGNKIHNPLHRQQSELRSHNVNLKMEIHLQLPYLVLTLMHNVKAQMMVNVVIQ